MWEKISTVEVVTDENGASALHVEYLRLQTRALRICTTYCFCTATVVAGTERAAARR